MNGLRLDFNSSETVVQDISSPTRNRKKLPEQYPAFAAILSFLYHYALLLGCVGDIDIKRISQWFHNDTRKSCLGNVQKTAHVFKKKHFLNSSLLKLRARLNVSVFSDFYCQFRSLFG